MRAGGRYWLVLTFFLLGLVINICGSIPVDIDPVVVDPHPDPAPAPASEPAPAPAPAPDPAPDPSNPDHPSDLKDPENPNNNPHPGPDPNPAPEPDNQPDPNNAAACSAPDKRGNIHKRVLCVLDQTDTKAITTQIERLDENKDNSNRLLDSGDGRWPTSRVEKLGNGKLNMALNPDEGLTGCTVMFAYNQKGDVYMAHIWEVPSFATNKDYPEVRTDTEFIEFLENGQATSQNPQVWKGPALNSNAFKSSQTHVTWITPGQTVDGSPDFGAGLDLAQKHITGWLGDDTTYERKVYQRPEDDEEGVKPYFQYDPAAATRGARAGLNGRLMWGGPNGRVAWTKSMPGTGGS